MQGELESIEPGLIGELGRTQELGKEVGTMMAGVEPSAVVLPEEEQVLDGASGNLDSSKTTCGVIYTLPVT